MVGLETAQACLAGLDQVVSRQPRIVGPRAHLEARLGGDQQLVTTALDRFPDDLLGRTVRVDVGGVDEVHPGVQCHVDLTSRAVEIDLANVAELAATSEAHRSKGELGDA